MSGVSEIGIHISLEGGKEAAVQAAAVSDALKGVGDSAKSAGAGAVAGSGGVDDLAASFGRLDTTMGATSGRIADIDLMLARNQVMLDKTVAQSRLLNTDTGFLGTTFGLTGAQADKFTTKIKSLSRAVALTSLAIGAIAVFETSKMGLAYDDVTTKISATANLSSKAATQITNAFLHTSNSVTFSGQAIATAFQPVSGQLQSITHGSLNAASSMTFMNAAMNLSTASGDALSVSVSSVADVLQTYSLGVDKASYVSNIFFNTSRLTATSTTELASAMDSMHARLGQLVPSLADTSGLLYDLAQHGVSGSRGIRMATGAIMTLMSRTPGVNSMLEVMGLSVNSFIGPNGKFIGMANAIGVLQPALEKIKSSLRITAEQALFGAGAAEAFGKTVLAGPIAYDKSREAVLRHNAVQLAAEKVTKSLQGQVELLRKDFDNMGTTIGKTVLPVLVGMGKWMIDNKPIMIALAVLIGTVLVAAFVAWGVSLALAAIPMLGIAASAALLALAVLELVLPVVAVGVAIYFLVKYWKTCWDGIKIAFDFVWHYLDEILHSPFIAMIMGPIAPLILLGQHWKTVWTVIKDVVRDAWNFVEPLFKKFEQGLHYVGDAVSWASRAGSFLGHIFGFEKGGVVPGAVGAPMLAMVHGGEVITPPQNIYNATSTAMTPVMLGQAVSKIAPGSANSSAVPSQVIANASGGPGQPITIQLVVDRRVLAELVYTEMQQSYARR
jgi:TP901 family phage tail tape measure protein